MFFQMMKFISTRAVQYLCESEPNEYQKWYPDSTGWVQERENGCLSVQVLQEFYVTITRKLAHSLTGDVAAQLVSSLAEWHIHSPQPDDVLGAIDLHQRYQISFWDAMIIRSALRMGCDRIWSEELNPTQIYDGVQVVNPFS
jgi:predicted nucleic acid-binding protein